MPTALQKNKSGEWEVFEYTEVINKYQIDKFDAASDAIEVIEDIKEFDELYEEE